MARADRYSHAVTVAATRHSSLAHAARELEIYLRRAAWASLWVDYQICYPGKSHPGTSARTERLFKDADNAAARRRYIMKGYSDRECEEAMRLEQ